MAVVINAGKIAFKRDAYHQFFLVATHLVSKQTQIVLEERDGAIHYLRLAAEALRRIISVWDNGWPCPRRRCSGDGP